MSPIRQPKAPPSIWWWAFGYFAAYAPYTMLTKALSSGDLAIKMAPPSGIEMLPSTVMAATVASALFLIATGWWKKARRPSVFGGLIPMPRPQTVLSGLCASGIIATTTLAYTFSGVSIVFVMLLMRGGLLCLAPIVDVTTGRKVRWFSLAALGLSLTSLVVAFLGDADYDITLLCGVDVLLYLGFYFVRLQLMSRGAKSSEPDANLRFFVEEQLVSSPALLIGLGIAALVGQPALRAGFTTFWSRPDWYYGIVIGVLSQGTGIFGGLILLDGRENTFCVPVNRASSVLAGLVASFALCAMHWGTIPPLAELVGASFILAAIIVLTIPPMRERNRLKRAAARF